MLKNVYGIDVGNYDTKSALESTSSAYTTSRTQPVWEKEYLQYNDMYYIPSNSRSAFEKDKTTRDKELILALISIGKETLARLEKNNITETEQIQEAISKIKHINLGVGLPPRYMSKEKTCQTMDYYKEKMGKGIQFEYTGYSFSFDLQSVQVFPQGLLPSLFLAPDSVKRYGKYYGIDIGGYTVDVIFIVDGKSDFEKTVTIEKGVLPLYEKIIDKVMIEQGVTLEPLLIEDVLMQREHILDDEIVAIVNDCTVSWVDEIINTLTQKGVNLKTYPSCWSGGGSLLFRPHIDTSSKVAKQHSYIEDVNANAKCYQNYIQATHKQK